MTVLKIFPADEHISESVERRADRRQHHWNTRYRQERYTGGTYRMHVNSIEFMQLMVGQDGPRSHANVTFREFLAASLYNQ